MEDCELFLGRVQPPTKAHCDIIAGMKNPVVVLVRATKSPDRLRNPFPYDYQRNLLLKVDPKIKVREWVNGYVPDIIQSLKSEGLNVTAVYAGSDRIHEYARMINQANQTLSEPIFCHLYEVKRTGEDVCATRVRTALKNNDLESYRKMMPKQLHDEFDRMKTMMSEDGEGGAAAPTNTASGVANKEQPIDKKIERRKTYKDFTQETPPKTP